MQAAELDKLQDSIRADLAKDGLSAALSALKKALPEQTEKYNLVFQLETRLNRINKDRIKGILTQEDLEIAYNRLSDDILSLVADLKVEDFDPATATDAEGKRKTGALLYQIPRKMELNPEKSYRCIVRLAFTEDVIVENIDLNADTEIKPVRVSEIMEVELKDPNDAPAFQIQLINSAEQFLEENAYTEWQFKVKPIRVGELPLLLVVAVKEYIHDRPVKREIVLEEIIEVIAEPMEEVEPSTDFQSAGYTFLYSSEPEERKAVGPITTIFNHKYSAVASVLLVFMIAAGIWALGTKLGWFNRAPKIIETPKPPQLRNGDKPDVDKPDPKTKPDSTSKTTDTLLVLPLDGPKTKPSDTLIAIKKNQKPTDKPLQDKDPKNSTNRTNSKNSQDPKNPTNTTTPANKVENKETKTVQVPDQPSKLDPDPTTKIDTAAKTKTEPEPDPVKLRKSGFTMVKVEGGDLLLGKHYDNSRCPSAALKINSFRLGKYEITQADWEEIMGKNPSFKSSCADCPVENVSWNDVQEFIQKASQIKGKKYRLPYEAEWEYAALGGKNPEAFDYPGSEQAEKVAWFSTIKEHTHKVGLKKPNNLEIYDLGGNVREWCQGSFPPYLQCQPENEGKKPLRGGSWVSPKGKIKITARADAKVSSRDEQSGLRLVEE